MKSKTVVVIGAGVGGICAATHLAHQGLHVTVFEKNPHPGGRCDQIERDGHRFDTGPTLMVMQRVYEAEFSGLGCSMNDLLSLQQVDPTYQLVFDDGSHLALTTDMQSMHDQLELMEQGAYDGFRSYHKEGERHYRLGMERLVNRDYRRFTDLFTIRNIPLIYQIKPLVNHYSPYGAFF